MKLNQSEKTIENHILSYLKIKGIWCHKIETVGIFDPKIGRYRMKHSIHRKVGIADIIGIYHGRFLAIEVKSAKGVLSTAQKQYLLEVKKEGGIAFVARSIDDVRDQLEIIDREGA